MVAKIKIGKSIRGILHYNETKVAEGDAKIILASGFAGEIEQLNFQDKLKRFQHLTDLKPSVKTNALHISLNFDSSEKITSAKMQEIAIAYMERIGFGDQPYLVYRHNDAGHQHMHIATTSIQRDGEVIKTHNIGRNLSEPARKSIEKDYNLIIAEQKHFKLKPGIKAADLQKAKYGKSSTKRQISNVLSGVLNDYKYTSFSELNAILREFNVMADRGIEGSDMFQNKGLTYTLISNDGKKIGIPIKSSAFYSKPTLRNLEMKFENNKERRKSFKHDLVGRINKVFTKYDSITKDTLFKELQKERITLTLRQNDTGRIYGATFIDHQNKTVFNGSDLGKLYSANALIERISSQDLLRSFLKPISPQLNYLKAPTDKVETTFLQNTPSTNFLNELLSESYSDYTPIIKRRKRKKRSGGLTI